MKTVLLTGAAGFIGWKTAERLLKAGERVIGVDNMNDYYDVRLKEWRLQSLKNHDNFLFYLVDIEDIGNLKDIFKAFHIDAVINLAARAGVRYSLENPFVYLSTNAMGHLNILELCREFGVKKVVLASTSSLYAGQPVPFREELPVNNPISPYAASKKSAEVMSYSYYYLYGISTTVLRYFTVYGPAGRPDMSIFRFIEWIYSGKELILFGDGTQSRDFTYVDDIAEGTVRALEIDGYEIVNLGGNKPHPLNKLIDIIETLLDRKAVIKRMPFHKADMKETWADISKAGSMLDWKPQVKLEEGIEKTVRWHIENRKWLNNISLEEG